jgi:phosphopentomutase
LSRRAAIIVLDGLGIGAAHDQAAYGDEGSDTLGNTLRWASQRGPVDLPALAALGLGNCAPLEGLPAANPPQAAFGTAQPASAGKDSTTGHWELCGLVLEEPFPTFPNGFPPQLITELSRRTGRGVLGNKAASGTAIIDELALDHRRTGAWILYTSADSVLQIAADEGTIPIDELYRGCAIAREICVGPWGVSRVIARPFEGAQGRWRRTERRKDFSLEPTGDTLLDRLERVGIPRVGVGKVDDLFAERGIQSEHTASNGRAYQLIEGALATMESGLLLANVIEFDQTWGHRNDVAGFVGGLAELDRAVGGLLARAQPDDLIIFTADHGNDPTTPSTDHARERVPVLAYGPKLRPVGIGERASFADVGQTVAQFLGVEPLPAGRSFLGEIWDD